MLEMRRKTLFSVCSAALVREISLRCRVTSLGTCGTICTRDGQQPYNPPGPVGRAASHLSHRLRRLAHCPFHGHRRQAHSSTLRLEMAKTCFTPNKTYQSVVFPSPELEYGATYFVFSGGNSTGTATDGLCAEGSYQAGAQETSLTLESIVTGGDPRGGGFHGMPGGRQRPQGGGRQDLTDPPICLSGTGQRTRGSAASPAQNG